MSQTNQISASLTPANKTAVTNNIAAIADNLKDVLLFNLSAQERLEFAKMGDKTIGFVEKAIDYAQQNPRLVPTFLDIEEAEKDFTLARDLYSIYQQLNTLCRSVEDALMVAGGEAYDASLIFYNSLKTAQRSNEPGIAAIYEDLQTRFPKRSKKIAPTNPS